MANIGQSSPGVGPRQKPNNSYKYFKSVEKDLQKRFNNKTGIKKLKLSKKEK
jgi:hypothetical protein